MEAEATQQHESPPLSTLNLSMITFHAVLFKLPDTSGLPGSSCLNEEPRAQWTESLFHNQQTNIPHFWCQCTALSILGNWLTPAMIGENANSRASMRDGFLLRCLRKAKVRLCGRGPPPLVPGLTLLLYYSSFLFSKLPMRMRKVTFFFKEISLEKKR